MKLPYRPDITPEKADADRRVLELLSNSFPNISAASTEIINLEAILNLPKGTEHFVADLHGEHEAFIHILRNASGNIKRKVTEIFGTSLASSDIRELCTLIYYALPPCEGASVGIVEVYALQGAQGAPSGICLYNRGAAA